MGLYTMGNVVNHHGEIDYFAIWVSSMDSKQPRLATNRDDGLLGSSINLDDIVWPDLFMEYGVYPQSSKAIDYRVESVDETVVIITRSLSVVSMVIVIVVLILHGIWRNHQILRAASWRLNMITCSGCMCAYLTVIAFGVYPTDIWCNVREWMMVIAWTLTFMPLFLKTYRVSVIFTGMMKVKTVEDYKLVIGVGLSLLVDITILAVFTLIEPERVSLVDGPVDSVHELLDIQIR